MILTFFMPLQKQNSGWIFLEVGEKIKPSQLSNRFSLFTLYSKCHRLVTFLQIAGSFRRKRAKVVKSSRSGNKAKIYVG